MKTLDVLLAGRVPYRAALAWQRALAEERIAGRRGDLLLLLEHDPVVTLGRTSDSGNLLQTEGLDVVEVERGGDVTYHGPGQLVGYPILDLSRYRQDLHWYLRTLEDALIAALARLNIAAGREPGRTGVWTGGRKIASIGVHVKRWVTWHGFALNVTTDLKAFDRIVPCGIPGVVMTSIEREGGRGTGDESLQRNGGRGTGDESLWMRTVDAVVAGFEEAFQVRAQRVLAEAIPA
ncbi:MAG TPA: lipoyl(octanoyl) transferase LipB [Gemmatimonadales bacterium]|nr:lipoyl(octanoyl) transferase LipB [Gemmatimonadales bacterium]